MSVAKIDAKLRVLLADNHAMIREGLKLLINSQPDMEVVGEAENGRAAVQQAQRTSPDVLVVDTSLPRVAGASVVRYIKRVLPAIKLLALSVHEDRRTLQETRAAGASGYVLTRSSGAALLDAIRIIAPGGVYIDPTLATEGIDASTRKAPGTTKQSTSPMNKADGGARCKLSEREADVLRRSAQGYANKEIAAQLGLSIKTVETYKARSVEKLRLSSRVDVVQYAMKQGWLSESGTVSQ